LTMAVTAASEARQPDGGVGVLACAPYVTQVTFLSPGEANQNIVNNGLPKSQWHRKNRGRWP
jgi:hypothetical protein